jgi:hypothetical protein
LSDINKLGAYALFKTEKIGREILDIIANDKKE